MLRPELSQKYQTLQENLRSLGSVAVAFSSGVDSTLLLRVSHDLLGTQAVAVTARSCSFPHREFSEAGEFCRREGIEQVVLESEELEVPGFAENPPTRCYLCKHELFSKILAFAKGRGLTAVAEGSNVDDLGDYRPGLQAIAELGVRSPLREAGLTKTEIRELSRELGLPTWEKPSFACLASRFVYGERITREKLLMVEAAEEFLHDLGLRQRRVRVHGDLARIEAEPQEIARLAEPSLRKRIVEKFRELGFLYVSLDLEGYRTGKMNRGLL
ncbi:MAG: ATP-dependent sacrificial sulfur transferase LarE [Victivallales bacterium]|nr:ATP-dependent sacrificial sulfur transferase LarE [Victivallales bacterium]